MFTGIITELGTIVRRQQQRGLERLHILAPHMAEGCAVGDSVAINGACLSVVRVMRDILEFEMIPETRALTNLSRAMVGSKVNLEPSLSLSDRLHGHLVLGHVDGMGRIRRREQRAGQTVLTIQLASALRRYLVSKGPVAIDGVSLTVGGHLSNHSFSVFLIPETLRKTTLGFRHVGDFVNIEVDYFAKLLLQRGRP